MAKRKVIRNNNRPFTYNPHYYSWGGDLLDSLNFKDAFNLKDTFSGANVGNMLKGGISGAAGSLVGKIGGNLIGGGLESGAGSAISNIGGTIGGAVGAVNPLLGGIISAGSGIIGGLTNRMFGSKLNEETIAGIESSNKAMNTLMVDSSSFDSVSNQWANQNFGEDFSKSDIGEDGWFSNKAKNKYKALQTQQNAARNRALTSFENATESADTQSDLNILGNFAAYGGPLYYPKTNEKGQVVLNPDNPQDIKWLHEQQGKRGARAVNKAKREAVPLIGTVLGLPLAGTLGTTIGLGGISAIGDAASIIMNPSDPLNYIGMPWTKMAKQADKILNVSKAIDSAIDNSKIVNIPVYHGTNHTFDDFNYASSQNIGVHAGTRKAANDRLNAIGVKKDANIREGVLTMNEDNIIPIKDIQNFDVYNMSQLYDNNMLFKQSLKKAGIKNNIFKQYITPMADDAQTMIDNKKLVNDLAERGIMFKYINKGEDIGSTSYLITNPNRVTWSKNRIKKFGGELFTNDVTIIGNGGTHESNPYEGVQMGVDPQGIPNLVEEGEVIFNDYVFSNRLIVPDAVREKYKLRGNKELTFADAAKQVQKESKERPNDPISKRGLMSAMSRLQQEQEVVREEKQASQEGRQYAKGGKLGNLFAGPGEKTQVMARAKAKRQGYNVGNSLEDYLEDPVYENTDDNKSDLSWLRYAPVVGSAIGLGQNLLSKPDYSNADAILAAAEKAGTYTPVGFDPIGNYLQYTPLDRNFYINKLNAQAGANRRAIMNTSSPSRNAALLAADYNAQGRLGDLARQAEEYNLAQRQAVEQFNRATNMTNAEMGLKAAMANQKAAMKAAQQRLAGTTQAMAMRDEIAARRGASMSANLTNFFNSLGEIGREEYSRNMIMSNPALYYSIDKNTGKITYKNGYEDLSEAEKKEVRTAASKAKSKKAKGGYLTIKKGGRHG